MRLALALAVLTGALPAAAQVKVGDRAAAIKAAETPSGKPITWAKLRGTTVVLTFGASWCKPCKRELPALDRLAINLIKNQKRKHLRFIAVNLDDERADGERFIESLHLDCIAPIYDPNGRLGASYRPRAMPTTYLIDKHGVVRHIHTGYQPGDETKLRKALQPLL